MTLYVFWVVAHVFSNAARHFAYGVFRSSDWCLFPAVRLSTVGCRTFPVAGACMQRFTFTRYLLTVSAHFKQRL